MKGNSVRQLRRIMNLSQSKLARRCGVNVRTVQRWENDERVIAGPAKILLNQLLKEAVGEKKIFASKPKPVRLKTRRNKRRKNQ